jgi:hypothetical protein
VVPLIDLLVVVSVLAVDAWKSVVPQQSCSDPALPGRPEKTLASQDSMTLVECELVVSVCELPSLAQVKFRSS